MPSRHQENATGAYSRRFAGEDVPIKGTENDRRTALDWIGEQGERQISKSLLKGTKAEGEPPTLLCPNTNGHAHSLDHFRSRDRLSTPSSLPSTGMSDSDLPTSDGDDDMENLNSLLQTRETAPLIDSTPNAARSDPFMERVYSHGGRVRSTPDPPTPGARRVNYTCECGEKVYIDLKELSPGGIREFCQSLIEAGAHQVVETPVVGDTTGFPEASSADLLEREVPSSHISGRANLREVEMHDLLPTDSPNAQSDNGVDLEANVALDPKYLLLCMAPRHLYPMMPIDVTSVENKSLFKMIHEQYKEFRQQQPWAISSVLPKWLTFKWFPMQLPVLPVFRPQAVDFVEFLLAPLDEGSFPIPVVKHSIPPKELVEVEKTYHYSPLLSKVEIANVSSAFIHALLTPDHKHLDKWWVNLLPKKIGPPPEYVSEPDAPSGWGIQIMEGLNWPFLRLSFALVLIGVAIFVIVCGVVTGNFLHAAALGSFMLALFAAYVPVLYFSWKDQLS